MKEFKYKSIPGLETQNTPDQLDLFETKDNRSGLKNRYLYDFSASVLQDNGSTLVADAQPNNFLKRVYSNLQPDTDWDYDLGNPGTAELMVKGIRAYEQAPSQPLPPAYSSRHIYDTVSDVTETRFVPYWNENCMMYLDYRKDIAGGGYYTYRANYFKTFRSGYVEIVFKTDKQNCILGFGSALFSSYETGSAGPSPESAGSQVTSTLNTVINNTESYINEGNSTNTLQLKIENGKLKLEYSSTAGSFKKSFEVIGNKNVADNEWHHVVFNFNKPGMIIDHGKKTNKKSIEFWIDGQLDKKSYDHINDNQVVYPMIEWLLMNPLLAFANTDYERTGWETSDGRFPSLPNVSAVDYDRYLALFEFRRNDLEARKFNDLATPSAFRGSVNFYVAGMNIPLDKYEIQQRNRLLRGYELKAAKAFSVSANIVNPTITTNKKKALKLFWNNLINDRAKNGVDLDNNYQVESYSVTHKTLNSCTEIHNVDLAKERTLISLKDVRVAFKEHVNIFGPGKDIIINRTELTNAVIAESFQLDPSGGMPVNIDGLNSIDLNYNVSIQPKVTSFAATNLAYSGVKLEDGDRVLLTNQINKRDNGVYIYSGPGQSLVRADDANSPSKLNNSIVRVVDGYYKNTTWALSNQISSIANAQEWIELEYHPNEQTFNTQPIFTSRWSNADGTERFIDLEQDVDINKYDLIVFMNYPENGEQIEEHFVIAEPYEIVSMYKDFIKSIQNVVAQGASLHVASPKLAEDLGIVKKFTYIDQSLENSDARSAISDPFAFNEPATRYFDTHRINQYSVITPVTGLTNKETYLLTDFINYIPQNTYEYEEYHAKYSYRQFGLQEGNEFFIPGLSVIKSTENEKLPGYNQNQKKAKPLAVVAPSDLLVGTVVTQLQNNYYVGSNAIPNPYDDYASTIIVHNGQILNNQPINGKIFINCVEDSYTFSREEYNKAVIQIVPQNDPNETAARLSWQYSTKRLNRSPQRINISELTTFGQTKPTNGGGGPLIQAPSSSSNGIIRSITDSNNMDYQSDLYANTSEEIYPTQIIPVLSMTWLGLKWLAE